MHSDLALPENNADPLLLRHYCTSVEASSSHPQHFKVGTAEKKWHFSADSAASRDEWVKTLKRVVFRCQNEGESVKVHSPPVFFLY